MLKKPTRRANQFVILRAVKSAVFICNRRVTKSSSLPAPRVDQLEISLLRIGKMMASTHTNLETGIDCCGESENWSMKVYCYVSYD
jgi:hypothetical protein